MKRLILPLILLSNAAFSAEPLTKTELNEIESLLAEAGGKAIYLSRDCDKPIDPEKFKELSKLLAFSEGYMSIEGVNWEHIARKAHQEYGRLKIQAPLGELCEEIKTVIKGDYNFLK